MLLTRRSIEFCCDDIREAIQEGETVKFGVIKGRPRMYIDFAFCVRKYICYCPFCGEAIRIGKSNDK